MDLVTKKRRLDSQNSRFIMFPRKRTAGGAEAWHEDEFNSLSLIAFLKLYEGYVSV